MSLLVCQCHGGVFLSPSIHSLYDNVIGDEGAKALSEAMKTMTNLQELQ